MPMDQDKAKNVQDSFNNSTGLMGLKKMFGMKEDPMSVALQKRKDAMKDMKEEYDRGPVLEYK